MKAYGFRYNTFHLQTWTVYMEMYARDSMVLILEFWQKLIGQLAQLMSGEMSEMVSVFCVLIYLNLWLYLFSIKRTYWRYSTSTQ